MTGFVAHFNKDGHCVGVHQAQSRVTSDHMVPITVNDLSRLRSDTGRLDCHTWVLVDGRIEKSWQADPVAVSSAQPVFWKVYAPYIAAGIAIALSVLGFCLL